MGCQELDTTDIWHGYFFRNKYLLCHKTLIKKGSKSEKHNKGTTSPELKMQKNLEGFWDQ